MYEARGEGMEKKLLTLLTILLLVPSAAFADNFMTAETRIALDDSVHSALIVTLDSPSTGEITVPIFGSVKNIKYDANFDGFTCRFEERAYGLDAICDVSKLKRSGTFKIEFDSTQFIEKADNQYTLRQQIATPTNLARLTFKVTLPKGTALSNEPAYLPFDGANSTDGRNIFVYWNREDVVAGEVFTAQVTYEKFSQGQNILLAGLFAFVAILAIVAILYRRRFSVKMVLPVLRDDEKLIMEKILSHKSGVNQKIIVRESGYSKAKVSKVLKSLEQRGVIKLERLGRSNKIFLNPDFENKS